MKNVVVLGGAYAGAHAFQILSQGLGEGFRVVLIDRNTHANHVYTFARYAVLPGHEHKAFIPYRGVLHHIKASDPDPPPDPSHVVLHAEIIDLTPHGVTIDRTFPELGFDSPVIPFKYAVYALGNRLPASIDFWCVSDNAIIEQSHAPNPQKKKEKKYDGTKPEGIEWFKKCQEGIRVAGSVLCVGGGALGIQFATDIKSVYPEKQVTLLHSRQQLLPRFDYELHSEVLKTIEDLGIDLIRGERLDMESAGPEKTEYNERGQRVVQTETGREVAADLLLLCTGQTPNTDLLAKMSTKSVHPQTKEAYVLRTMQLGIIPDPSESESRNDSPSSALETSLKQLNVRDKADKTVDDPPKRELRPEEGERTTIVVEKLPKTPFPHIFIAGDCANAFGAIKAGHTAFWQAEVASRNIIRLAQHDAELESKAKKETEEVLLKEGEPKKVESVDQKDCLELESYSPGPPAIKVSLGIGRTSAYQINGVVGRKDTPESDDLDAPLAWAFFGILDAKPEDMYS